MLKGHFTSYFLYIPGTVSVERQIHKQLAEHRIRGEWFNLPIDKAISILNSYTDPF